MTESTNDPQPDPTPLSRRTLLRGALAAVAVAGFDASLGSWATAADLASGRARTVKDFPHFDGQLLTDDASLAAAADDFGHAVHRRPQAVLKPASIGDVVRMIRFARQQNIQVAARGQGHSTLGQAQVAAGVVIDLSTLAAVHEINAGDALVDAGLRWSDLLRQTLPHGLAPAVLNDYIDLSIGGTLSLGGVGAQSYRQGAQVDNVLELTVVTGRGGLVTCSPSHRKPLFDAVRAGLGQLGVIVQARLRLVPAPPKTRYYMATYDDLALFLADLKLLIHDGRFDTVQGFVVALEGGGWNYSLETTKNFTPGHEPDDATLLAGLHYLPGHQTSQDIPYFDYLNRVGPTVEFLKQIGVWGFPHPWIDLFLPSSQTESFIRGTLADLDPADLGQGPVLVYPLLESRFKAPNLRVPAGETFFLFGLLRTAVPPTPERSAELVAANRRLYEQAQAVGGFFYPVDSVPMSRRDWRRHFGDRFPEFAADKQAYDPDYLLAPGQGIFTDR